MTHRLVVPLALALGLLAAVAPSGHATSPVPTTPAPAVAPPLPACIPARTAPAAPAPQAVLDAFGILRRERTDDDALPVRALRALRQAGLAVPDPTVARRLRRAGRGTAWIVPVADLRPLSAPGRCVLRRPVPRRARPLPARTARPPRTPRRSPVPAPAPAPLIAAPVGPLGSPTAPRPAPRDPQPGVAVVSLGDILGGGGGTLHDLLRGLAAPEVTPCAGPRDDLVGVSGVVPDGVEAVYLTAADGSAVRADVTDNGYTFLVPSPARAAMRVPRYVVWTTDGTPHVAPVLLPALPRRACAGYQRTIAGRTSISPQGVPALGWAPTPAPVSPARAPRRP